MAGPEQFISEPITPEPGSFDASAMARGEPGVPARFTWRGQAYETARLLTTYKKSSREGGRADGELYLRRHYFVIETACGVQMTLYCERQTRRKNPKNRWFLYTLSEPGWT